MTTLAPEAQPNDADRDQLKRAAECILLVSGGPVTVEQFCQALGAPESFIRSVLGELQQAYAGGGLQIQAVAGGYQLCTRPELAAYVQKYLRLDHREPISRAALETLAIVAYRQPVTRAEIEAVRGVRCEHVLERLLERHLIRELGRRPTLGRPILYGTTEGFLKYFGINALSDLPRLEGGDPRGALGPVAPAAEGASRPHESLDDQRHVLSNDRPSERPSHRLADSDHASSAIRD